MRIGIDIRTINKPKSGVGYYVTNLIREFQRIDQSNDYYLISNNCSYTTEFKDLPNFRNHVTQISNENHMIGDLWESLYLPSFLKRSGVNVFHGPAFLIPLRQGGAFRSIVTIHDIVAYMKPETVPLKYALYMKMLIKLVATKADKIITPSFSTKNDLIDQLDIPEENIEVVYNAVSDRFAPPDDKARSDIEAVKEKFNIRGRYMLFAGNLEPRKNLIRLMQAYDRARSQLGDEYQLVMCGKKSWLYSDIIKTYEKINGDGSIILTHYLSEDELLSLYQGADIFVFPSLYEGFGFPPLEAMGCGVPVITSGISSLPEIVGEAALLVDPMSVQEISDAMVKMASSGSLRDDLRRKGLEQAAKFRWKNTAQQTLDVYHSVV